MILEQLLPKWLSATALKKVCYLCSILFFVFWIGWNLFFLIKSPWVLPTELDLFKALLLKSGMIPYLDFEDLRWPGRYLLWGLSHQSFILALNWCVLIFWGLYFFIKLKKLKKSLFWSLAFFLSLLLFQGAFTTLQFLLTPVLVLWLYSNKKNLNWLRVIIGGLVFLIMPTLFFIYFFVPDINVKEKVWTGCLGVIFNILVLIFGASLGISWTQALYDFWIYWIQDSELSQLTFKILIYGFFTQTLKMLFTPIFSFALLLIFLPLLFAHKWSFLFLKKIFRKYRWLFLALVLYPCLSFKFFTADYLFFYLFLILGASLLLIKRLELFSLKIFGPLTILLLLGTGMRSFSWFYHDQEYLRPPYNQVRDYLKTTLNPGEKFLVYAGGENRFFLLHRDLNSPPWLYMWDKFNLFIQLHDQHQAKRQIEYINRIHEVSPRFILVPPVSTINPNGQEVLNDFYDLMDLRTQAYKVVKSFDSFFGPIVLYEKN